jgi:hypothetical protein
MEFLIWINMAMIYHLIYTECFGGRWTTLFKNDKGIEIGIAIVIIFLVGGMFFIDDEDFNTYMSFAGAILGSSVGGMFALMAVRQTIRLQSQKEDSEKVPQKIITIDNMLDKVNELHSQYDSLLTLVQQTNNNIQQRQMINGSTPQHLLGLTVTQFSQKVPLYRKELITLSAQVNSETYTFTRNFFKRLKELTEILISQNYRDMAQIDSDLLQIFQDIKEINIQSFLVDLERVKDSYDRRFI